MLIEEQRTLATWFIAQFESVQFLSEGCNRLLSCLDGIVKLILSAVETKSDRSVQKAVDQLKKAEEKFDSSEPMAS